MNAQRERYWSQAHKAERQYSSSLRKIARHIDDIVKGFDPRDPRFADKVGRALRAYGKIIEPWARSTAQRMVNDVARRNEVAWRKTAERMGRALADEIKHAPTGIIIQDLMQGQAALITSLPIEAAQRVQDLALEGLQYSDRGDALMREIMRTGEVTRSRATLIARTETARATSTLTQARATFIGSTGYIWRTAKDEIVRVSHRAMEGEFVRWDTPPQVDPGKRYHAGCFPNCRCYPEPVIPDIYG